MKKVTLLLCFLFVSSLSFAADAKKEILVSAASSLKDVFTELGKDFEKKQNIKVSFNFAGSGQLKAQIETGAPVDVFASAALADMEDLEKKALVSDKFVFAKNALVLIQNVKTKSEIKNLEGLKNSGIKKIALGNPASVPAGRYAKESLEFAKIFDTLKDKMVFAENVRQVLEYVSRHEVEAGFVFLTDALSDKNVRMVYELPENFHKPIQYPIAVIKASKQTRDAKAFIDFVMSAQAQSILKKYGFK